MDQPKNVLNTQGSINIWAILAAVVITAVIVGGVTYYFQKTASETEKQSLQQQMDQLQTQISRLEQIKDVEKQEPVAKQQPAEDQYKDWKTYKNEKYGFEIKYPQSLSFIDIKEDIDNQGNVFVRFNVKTTSKIWGIGDGKYDIYTIAIQPEEVIIQEYRDRGTIFNDQDALGKRNGKYYLFTRGQDVPEDWQNSDIPFNKIISSFKFTN